MRCGAQLPLVFKSGKHWPILFLLELVKALPTTDLKQELKTVLLKIPPFVFICSLLRMWKKSTARVPLLSPKALIGGDPPSQDCLHFIQSIVQRWPLKSNMEVLLLPTPQVVHSTLTYLGSRPELPCSIPFNYLLSPLSPMRILCMWQGACNLERKTGLILLGSVCDQCREQHTSPVLEMDVLVWGSGIK